ncbi:MAG: DUF1330 domain-containing protein [Bacteroidota bacterium]
MLAVQVQIVGLLNIVEIQADFTALSLIYRYLSSYTSLQYFIMKIDQVHPSKAQLEALKQYPQDTPVVMVNIIKYKVKTEAGTETGKTAYKRYLHNVTPLIEKASAQVLWRGTVAQTVIGDESEQADVIFMVQYPSVQHFFNMIYSSEYQAVSKDRSIALEFGGLIACQTI